jgi:hypothetical protein
MYITRLRGAPDLRIQFSDIKPNIKIIWIKKKKREPFFILKILCCIFVSQLHFSYTWDVIFIYKYVELNNMLVSYPYLLSSLWSSFLASYTEFSTKNFQVRKGSVAKLNWETLVETVKVWYDFCEVLIFKSTGRIIPQRGSGQTVSHKDVQEIDLIMEVTISGGVWVGIMWELKFYMNTDKAILSPSGNKSYIILCLKHLSGYTICWSTIDQRWSQGRMRPSPTIYIHTICWVSSLSEEKETTSTAILIPSHIEHRIC